MIYCPQCGNALDNYGRCPNCGYVQDDSVIEGDAVEKESVDANETLDNLKEKMSGGFTSINDDFSKIVPGWIKALLIIVTIFISPVFGLICSIVLLTRPYPAYKTFGIVLLIISLVFMLLSLVYGLFAGLIALIASFFHFSC